MSRILYDLEKFKQERVKLSKPDGVHCIICGKPFDVPDKRRSYCNQDCYNKWYISLDIDSWARVKEFVLKRDGKCLNCGVKIGTPNPELYTAVSQVKYHSSTVVFEVHHILPISEGGDEFDPDNLMTLCYDCHKEKHSISGKRRTNNHSLEEFIHA